MIFRLAIRNLVRNLRRTLITGLGIALSLGLMTTSNNIAGGQYQDMVRVAVARMAGHVVVQAEGYQAEPDADRVVQRSGALEAELQALFPEGTVTRRVFLGGLLSSARSAVAVQLTGVRPEAEDRVADHQGDLAEGEWLGDDELGVVLGVPLAQSLGVELGDRVVFMAQVEGEMESRLFRVAGLVDTGAVEADAMTAYALLPAVQGFLPGVDPAHQVAVHLPEAAGATRATELARSRVDADAREILHWREALPDVAAAIELDARISDIMWGIMGLIVAMGVLNTVLMSTLERTREFGIMMAVGLRPGRTASLVLLEGLLLGVVGAVLGLALGALFTWPFAVYGLEIGEAGATYETAGVHLPTRMYAVFDWSRNAVFAVAAVFITVLASLGPALRVRRLTPVEAIRYR